MGKLKIACFFAAIAVLGFSLGLAFSPLSQRPKRSAQTILAEHNATKIPSGFLDHEQVEELERACRKRAELALELMQSWPDHPRVPKLAEERWALLENTFAEHDTVLAETARVMANSPAQALALATCRARAWSSLHSERVELDQALAYVQAARELSADDEWCAMVLLFAAQERTADPIVQRALCAQIRREHPGARSMDQDVRAFEKLLAHLDAPLVFDFVDLATNQPASLAKWIGVPILLHVRRSFDWKPLPESELAELESRHRDIGLVALELMVGKPDTPSRRPERQLIAPHDEPLSSWEFRFGILQTPMFLIVGTDGRLCSLSHSLQACERWLAFARKPAK